MREVLTTTLDALGLLLLAAGAAALTFRWLGWGCLLVAGVVVLGGSLLAASLASPRRGERR